MEFEPKDKETLIKEWTELYNKEGADALIDEYNWYMESLWEWLEEKLRFMDKDYDLEEYAREVMWEPFKAMEEVYDNIESDEQVEYIGKYVDMTNDEYNVKGLVQSIYEGD